MRFQQLIWLFAFPLTELSAQVSLFERVPGQAGNVIVAGLTDERPPALQGIHIDPLDCIGRTRLTELLPDQSRPRMDVPGAGRLVLPGDRGSLYKYRRRNSDLSITFGYFRIGPNGIAREVFELVGTGSLRATDPIPGRVAVAADGRALLVASSEAAGGDLWEIDLITGTAQNRTQDIEPQKFQRNGLVLLPQWGFAVSEEGVFRFNRSPGEQALGVPVPNSPDWFGPDVVQSKDGSTVAFLAGAEVSLALVFTCRRTGVVVQASDRPMRITGAGFLPEDPAGPSLALSTDGSWVAWRLEAASRECFVRQTRGASRPTDQHITGPSHFDYTLNDTGVIAFVDPDSLVLVAGRHETNGITGGDLYRVDLTGGAFAVSNLSRTSGITQPPFDYGTLETQGGLYQVPGPAPAFLLHEYGPRETLLWVTGNGETTEVLAQVEELESLDVAGAYLVAGVTRPAGVNDPLNETLDLVQIPPGGQGSIVMRLPEGCHLTRGVGSRTRSVFAAVLEFQTGERLGQVRVPSPSGIGTSSLLSFGPTTGMTSDGAILATVQIANGRAAFAWDGSNTQLLRMSRLETFLLPGL